MKVLGVLGVCALAFALPARGDGAAQINQPLLDTLTPIDTLPSSQQINNVFDDDPALALAGLQDLANPPPTSTVDRGVQIRAVRALVSYCATTPCADGDVALTTLRGVELRYRDARSGSDLLVLRAAIESLGVLRVTGDWLVLSNQLQHPNRDIRAAAARALRDLGNTQAITPLRNRYNVEQVLQVKQAISDALRVLGQPIP